jgi:hypothetical protein
VEIEAVDLDWQNGRYSSGMHCCVPLGDALKYPELYRLKVD